MTQEADIENMKIAISHLYLSIKRRGGCPLWWPHDREHHTAD